MTTRLQWRDVSAPNYTNAIQGLSLFGQQFGNGMSGLSDALAGFQKDRSQAAEQQVMRAAQAYPDPAEYQRALASGQLYRDAGINPEFLTREALNGLNNQATTMIDRATKQQSLTADQFKHRQLVKTTEALEASKPAIAKLISDATGMNFSDEQLNQLPAAQLMKLAENTNALKSTKLGNDVTSASIDSTKQARADADELARFNNAFPDVAFDRNSATAFFKNFKFSNERVRQAAAASLDKYYGSGVVNLDAAAPASSSAPSAQSGTGVNAALGSAVAGGTGGSVPRVDQIMSGLFGQESGNRQVDASGKTITSPKGALGVAQIMPATGPEAAKLAGLPYDENRLKTDRDYNAALGKAYFTKQLQDFGGDERKALAAYNAGPGAMRTAERKAREAGIPDAWLNFLPKETQDYVPGVLGRLPQDASPVQQLTASVVPTAAQRTSTQMTLGALRDRTLAAQIEYGSPATERIQQIISDPTRRSADFNTVATGLVEQFKGVDDTISKSDITTYLRRVMQKGKINSPAVAAEFIKDSAEGTMFGGRKWYGETSVDDATLEATIDTWKKGGFEQGSDYLRQLDVVGKGLTSAQTAYDQAVSRYRRLELAIQNGRPDMASGLPALEQEVRKAESQLAAAQIAAESIKAPTRERVPLRQGTPTQGTAGTQGNEKKLPSWGSVFHLSR